MAAGAAAPVQLVAAARVEAAGGCHGQLCLLRLDVQSCWVWFLASGYVSLLAITLLTSLDIVLCDL